MDDLLASRMRRQGNDNTLRDLRGNGSRWMNRVFDDQPVENFAGEDDGIVGESSSEVPDSGVFAQGDRRF